MASKTTCPHCSKSFVNVALHITKMHDEWLLEHKTEKALVYDLKTKSRVWKERTVGWDLSKNGEHVCTFTSCAGTTSWNNDGTTYSDWHTERGEGKYIMLEDKDGAHTKTKIIYAHYKGATAWGISKTIVCNNLTVIG